MKMQIGGGFGYMYDDYEKLGGASRGLEGEHV
jgi:hypothetical protein